MMIVSNKTMTTTFPTFCAALALALALGLVLLAPKISGAERILSRQNNNDRQNLFDPIYAYDDIDAHIVSASITHNQPEDKIGAQVHQRQVRGGSSSANSDSTFSQLGSSSIATTANKQTTSEFVQTPTTTTTTANVANKQVSQQQQQQKQSSLPPTTSTTTRSANLVAAQQQGAAVAESRLRIKKVEPPAHHWSALENYYQKLRQLQQPPASQSALAGYQNQPIYQVLQQGQENDDLLSQYRPLGIQSGSPYSSGLPTILRIGNSPQVGQQQQQQQQQQILLPIITTTGIEATRSQQDPDFGFGSPPSLSAVSIQQQQNVAPGISRTGGIGSGSILLGSTALVAAAGSYATQPQPQQQQQQQQQQQVQQVQVQVPEYQHNSYPAAPAVILRSGGGGLPVGTQTSQQLPTVDDSSNIKLLEWRKLPELLFIQQQQQRAKHQQETFGSWYDHQRSRELLQEEAFCGPRNYVNFKASAPAPSPALPGLTLTSSDGVKTGGGQTSRIQFQIDPSGATHRIDIPITLSASEFPSHMGIYNGTPGESNYLCAATWVHERFALTLASCLASRDPSKLFVRAGEWNLNKQQQNSSGDRPMIVRQIESVSVFPKYRNDTGEHNLALVKLFEPINYLEVPYICPACQVQSRNTMRTSACWTPVRNINLSEYFDAEGEGETKERKTINMMEFPVRLIANDDNECYRQTKIEFFNFQHPNYICSPDYRSLEWRRRLNQTEYLGSGVYCNEGGNLSLVSILHQIPVANLSSQAALGFMDLSYYKPWMRNIISGRSF